jgi:hypothetical protein
LKKNNPYLAPTSIKGKALHSMTLTFISHWLHGNTIPKIGCHHFWLGLIAHLLIRTRGCSILDFVSKTPEPTVMEKKSNNHPILKCSPNVIVDCEFILFGDIL